MSKLPCTACGRPAAILRPAHVFLGPGDLRPGDVCDECAALGWLLVMGPDVIDAAMSVPSREKQAGKRKGGKRGAEQRRAKGSKPDGEPLPLPKSARETLLWKSGMASELLAARAARSTERPKPTPTATTEPPEGWTMEEEELYQKFKARLAQEAPALLKVLATKSELEVTVELRTVEADGSSLKGRVARLIAEDWFASERKQGAVRSELKRTGTDVNDSNLHKVLHGMVDLGLLTKESGGFRMAPGAQVRVKYG